MKNSFKVILGYGLALVAIIAVIAMLYKGTGKTEDPLYNDIVEYFRHEQVEEFVLGNDDVLELVLKDGKKVSYKLASVDIFHRDLGGLIVQQMDDGIITKGEYEPVKTYPWWAYYLPWVLLIIVIIVIYYFAVKRMMNSGGPGGKINNFGKARVKVPMPDDKNKVTFADVAGADEEKEELVEIVEYLKDPERYSKLGAKIPHGVLLMGPPGTGKTLLAKAVAGEAGVPFFSISGSDFVEMYVGVGASRVRDLFETARKAHAAIIFIDEIDAVGRHRGAGLGGGHDEREQTLNQLLVEMDGFGSHDGIIVIAATNRPDILDPALLRPGRFDRQITVNIPDIKGREDILKVHAKNKPFEPGVDFAEIAKTTAGFTGADLANLLNESALLAARRGKSLIGMAEIEDAFIKIIAGPKKKSRVMKEREKRNTAYHEAGHAMVAHLLGLDPVQQISIIPSGNALGYTLNPPAEDKYSVYKQELKDKISMLLAGRAAEEIIFGDVSGGASNDIQRATATAKQMVMKLGMSEILGPRRFGNDQEEVFLGRDFSSNADYSQEVAARIDSEIHDIISASYNKAKDLLNANIGKLHFIAEFLLKHEIMDGDQFRHAMDDEGATMESLEEIANEKKRKSEEANAQRAAEAEKEAAEAEAKAKNYSESKEKSDSHNSYDRGEGRNRYNRDEKDQSDDTDDGDEIQH
ncbi:MAG: ATP-dependent zinc metalloprotease FtsH [Clostridia bacterium]|nr:ATP-dependent zinc metalloprotease FtsH [Clostridia bacterium]